MDRPGVRQVPEGSGEQRKMEETGCEFICGSPTTLTVKGGIDDDDDDDDGRMYHRVGLSGLLSTLLFKQHKGIWVA